MDPVVHFEMTAKDNNRMRKFYEMAFGWQTEQLGGEMGEYILVTTTELDEKTGFPKRTGAINGGFYQRSEDEPESQYPSIVIAVDDIKKAMKKVEKAGGKVLAGQVPGEPVNIPGVGLYISFMDTEGNRVSMLEPVPM